MIRVLLIDRDAAVLQSLAGALKVEGYEVFTAESGQAGLNIAREK